VTFKIPRGHPYFHVQSLATANADIKKFFFSWYLYRPQSLLDERIAISISRDELLSESFVFEMLSNGPAAHELAFHSAVLLTSGETRHIPMIDMSTTARAHLAKLADFIGTEVFNNFNWFESGRSFHGYGSELLDQDHWRCFMGQLLVANQKDMKPTVDPRWVGHRLIAGYAALRWTKRTDFYLAIPELLRERGLTFT